MKATTKTAFSEAPINGRSKQSSKTQPQTPTLDTIPAELRGRPQWVVWKFEGRGKNKTKVPYNAREPKAKASSTNRETWSTFTQALKTWQQSRGRYHGIGYVFAADDPYCGIDLDKCISDDGAIDPDKLRWIEAFDSYTEITPSGRGFHIIVRGAVKQGHNDRERGFEVYSSGRYFTFTSHSYHSEPLPIAERQAVVNRFVEKVFPKPKPKAKPTKPQPESNGAVTINDRLHKAFSAKNGARLCALFNGDTSAYSGDDSAADLALCSMLAFWSDGNASTLDAMFRQSRLMRPKWDEKHYSDGRAYGEETINKALDLVTDSYNWQRSERANSDNGAGNAHSETSDVEPWEPPAAFHNYVLLEFPVDALPDWQKRFATELATATQTPVDLAAMSTLAVCAGAVARNVRIMARHGWYEPLNIFTATALPPGNRKSAVFADVIAPLEEYEAELLEAARDEIATAASEYRMLEAQREQAEKDCAKLSDEKLATRREQAITLARELAAKAVPVQPRLIVDDITSEQLATVLAEQRGRIALLSAEGGIFDVMAGRYSSGAPNFDVYLKGHSGDTLRVNRRGRDEHVKNPALTLGLVVQPDVIRGLVEKPGFRGRGLIGRFLYSLPVSTLGRRAIKARPMADATRAAYKQCVKALARIRPDQDSTGQMIPRSLVLSPEADDLLASFEAEIEPQLGDDGELASMSDWASKLCGAIVRLAGILHLAEHADRLDPWPSQVSADTLKRAVSIGRYLIPHAKAAYAEMGADEQIEAAKFVLRWIERYTLVTFTKRQAFEGTKGRFKQVAALEPALDLMEAHGYIRARTETTEKRAGRPSQTYDVNPYFRPPSQNSQNSQKGDERGDFANFANFANENHKAISETSSSWEVHPQ